jgi:hypothetical protein
MIVPTAVGFQIHIAKLPGFPRIIDPLQKPAGLFVLAHFEPVFHQGDVGVDDILFPGRTYLEESIVLFVRAKPHHSLNAGTVIPTPVQNNDFAPRRKMLEISLKVHL